MGESISEGSITAWRKHIGDRVEAGEALVDVTTDKVDVEVPSPAAGTLTRILAADGATVNVGAPLAEIDTSAQQAADHAPQKADGDGAQRAEDDGTPRDGTLRAAGQPSAEAAAAPGAAAARGRGLERGLVGPGAASAQQPDFGVDASPLARRKAAMQGLDLRSVTPSGPGGVVRKDDVAAPAGALPNGAPPAKSGAPAVFNQPSTTPLRGPAAALVAHMEQSLGIPTATSLRTISVGELDRRRRELNAGLGKAGSRQKISFTHLLAYALVKALGSVPAMTAAFARTADTPQRVERGVHLGLAVDVTRKDGTRFLVVPVVRAADELDFRRFVGAYEELVAKARQNALQAAELSGATITLTNPGGLGTTASLPRLMAGQGTIVAAGAIGYPPGFSALPEDQLRSLGVSKVMTLTSTYDHRVIQGAQSGEFLRRIEELLNGADGFYELVFSSLGVGSKLAPGAETQQQSAAGDLAELDGGVSGEIVRAAASAMALVSRYRTHGHTAANLDPLSGPSEGDPALRPESLNLTPELLAAVPASVLRVHVPGENLGDVLQRLRTTYCSTIAYEVEHISNHEQRAWLREQIESGAHLATLDAQRKLQVLDRLTRVEAFERYLRKAFLGQKTFSIEGLDAMVPMLEELVTMLAEDGVAEVDLGMAHRGRLSVITHVVDRPYEDVLAEFEHTDAHSATAGGDVTGDVKYHQGANGTYETASGKRIRVLLANNPSHLEAVNSVIEGRARAAQTDRSPNIALHDTRRAVPVLVHGDAAFPGQGSVAEVLNMQSLPGYTTGGTIHIIANNQIGFTTLPQEGRSTHYASDLAKGFDVPIVHVNADDIEACIGAVHLSVNFRRRFGRDALIDLIGYRRFGHNEADEPAYTQPLMYEKIRTHPTVRELFARRLIEAGLVSAEDVRSRFDAASKRIAQAHAAAKSQPGVDRQAPPGPGGTKSTAQSAAQRAAAKPAAAAGGENSYATRVAEETLVRINASLRKPPADFNFNAKLARQFERHRAVPSADSEVDWGWAEELCFASLLLDGKPIRLTGQDTERGTFSHRHLVLHDGKTGRLWTPMQHLAGARAAFEIYNSPLSEYACLGFEYGYSAAATDALVIWEAQFGDFANGAQVIIDQFISAGMAKWGQVSRLTLLLPHGYEGAGPEHSSARLERFLQLTAEGNMRVAYCSTPAQYFHLLRDQALTGKPRPLAVMTPKSLLRLKLAGSKLSDLSRGGFMPVIDDAPGNDRNAVRRLILCTGKVYYDLITDDLRAGAKDLAIIRVELLEPFPQEEVLALVASYPNVQSVTWVQEEPRNMGARAFVSRRLRERLAPRGITFEYVGRPDRASPSEGYPAAHSAEQERIVKAALKTQATGDAR